MSDPARIVVRPARPRDAATLTRIAHAAKRHWGYPEEWIRAWRAELTVDEEMCATEHVYCACEGDEIRGFYAMVLEDDQVSLDHMWVDPPYMGEGIGALLFRHACVVAERIGGLQLVIASDPNAEGFYLRMGARRCAEVASFPEGRYLPLLIVDLVAGARRAH